MAVDAEGFVRHITNCPEYRGQIKWIEDIPARPARYAEPQPELPEAVWKVLREDGIERLYVHQAKCFEHIGAGNNVAVVTGTASGKTLCYNVPVLTALLEDPETRALYIYPTKALAQDQLKTLLRWRERLQIFEAGTYDGDTPRSRRQYLRDHGNIILTNPDMLHSGILPFHARWAHFFGRLKYVVLDELHAYRGIFGTNVAMVMRRLRRICRHWGSNPQFILCSATIANPKEHAEALIGLPVEVVDEDGSPRGPKKFLLWNPPVVDFETGIRRSANLEAQWLMVELIGRWRASTIAFTRARVTAELLYRYVREKLAEIDPKLAEAVRSYRGGYLAQERREIERLLFSGKLLGVTSTNALELGIDIGTLEACLIVGYPGSISSTWQQAGRAGRGEEQSLAVLIAQSEPVDQYMVAHPEYFFGQPHERAVIDVDNPYVLAGHLRCAMAELPISGEDAEYFGELMGPIVRILAEVGEAFEVKGRYFWRGPEYPARDISVRSADPTNYVIQDITEGEPKVIGQVDEWSAFTLLHDDAVYLHEGDTYVVERLDLDQRVAYVRRQDTDYYTVAVDKTKVRQIHDEDDPWASKEVGRAEAGFGPVEVTSLVYMYRKVKFYRHESIGYGNLNLPPQELSTKAAYVAPRADVMRAVRAAGMAPEEGLLGIANAVAGVLPGLISCDPGDIGCVVDSAALGKPAVFIYDRYPGGVGFAEQAYERIGEVLEGALELIEACECQRGCPSCVGVALPVSVRSEDVDTRGFLPDKRVALAVLRAVLYGEMPKAVERAPVVEEAVEEAEALEVEGKPLPEVDLPGHVQRELMRRLERWRRERRGGE